MVYRGSVHLLAHRTAGGVNELETAVRRCAHLAPRGTVVGASMVRTVLSDLLRQAQNAPVRGDVDTILRAVCAEFGVTKDDLLSKKREATISQARQIAMYLLREDAGITVAGSGASWNATTRRYSMAVAVSRPPSREAMNRSSRLFPQCVRTCSTRSPEARMRKETGFAMREARFLAIASHYAPTFLPVSRVV